MAQYILKIGETKGVSVKAGNARKTALIIRDALRAAQVKADVIIEHDPKVLD